MQTVSRMQPASADTTRTLRSRLGRGGDEAASRRYLETCLEDADSETLLAVTGPGRPEVVPDMQIQNTATTPQLGANPVAPESVTGTCHSADQIVPTDRLAAIDRAFKFVGIV